MDFGPLLVFTSAFAVACAAPGPTIAALVARVLGRGTSGAATFCAGLILSDQMWLAIAYLGLAALAQVMQPIFVVLKYAGAAYLLWLAWKLWTTPAAPVTAAAPVAGEGWRLVLAGIAVGSGNPKTMLFYLALLPSLVDFGRVSPLGFAEMLAVLTVIYAVVLTAYVTLAARTRRLFTSARAMRRVHRSTAVVMAGAAAAVAARS